VRAGTASHRRPVTAGQSPPASHGRRGTGPRLAKGPRETHVGRSRDVGLMWLDMVPLAVQSAGSDFVAGILANGMSFSHI
jgi:hypothetical protein